MPDGTWDSQWVSQTSFASSCICGHRNGFLHCPEIHLLPRLLSSFIPVPYTWLSTMISHVGSSMLFYFWTWCIQTCSFFYCRRICPSLRPWCWVAPIYRQRYIPFLCPIAWTNLGNTPWVLCQLLPWHLSLVLSRHKCWHPQLLGGEGRGGLLDLRPLTPDCW